VSKLPYDGVVAVVKRDCPTCRLVVPVLAELPGVAVYSQDDPPVFPPPATSATTPRWRLRYSGAGAGLRVAARGVRAASHPRTDAEPAALADATLDAVLAAVTAQTSE
jgi:hypothetical protein